MYGLIGYPLGHSFSAGYFKEKFERENINEQYKAFPLKDIVEFKDLYEAMSDLKGVNVTIPYKQDVMKFLDFLSDDAEEIGAVNVVKINRNEEGFPVLKGYNSDWQGFSESLKPLLHDGIKGALVLGSGGASKAVCYALRQLNIKPLTISRKSAPGVMTYEDIDRDVIKNNLLIVNTTPLGMYPNVRGCPDLPYHYLTSAHVCYDLVYNPEITEFMKKSAAYGAVVKNGLEMLHRQAEISWEIWNSL